MNILKLQIIVLIEKYKKVTDVASELGLKQPTVSFHMKSLESELGAPLFQNRGGRVLLTEAGQALHQYAVRIVSLASEAERTVRKTAERSQSLLEIGASAIPSIALLPRVIHTLTAREPRLRITVSGMNDGELLGMLRSRELQLAVIHGLEGKDEALTFRKIADDEPVLAFAPHHPLAGAGEISPGQISSGSRIQLDGANGLRQFDERWSELNGISNQYKVEAGSVEMVKAMVEAGAGTAILSSAVISAEVSAGRLRVAQLPGVLPEQPGYFAVWRKDHALTPAEQALIECLIPAD